MEIWLLICCVCNGIVSKDRPLRLAISVSSLCMCIQNTRVLIWETRAVRMPTSSLFLTLLLLLLLCTIRGCCLFFVLKFQCQMEISQYNFAYLHRSRALLWMLNWDIKVRVCYEQYGRTLLGEYDTAKMMIWRWSVNCCVVYSNVYFMQEVYT